MPPEVCAACWCLATAASCCPVLLACLMCVCVHDVMCGQDLLSSYPTSPLHHCGWSQSWCLSLGAPCHSGADMCMVPPSRPHTCSSRVMRPPRSSRAAWTPRSRPSSTPRSSEVVGAGGMQAVGRLTWKQQHAGICVLSTEGKALEAAGPGVGLGERKQQPCVTQRAGTAGIADVASGWVVCYLYIGAERLGQLAGGR